MKRILAIPVILSLMLFCCGTVWAASQNPPSAPVMVVNPTTKPVPVKGPATIVMYDTLLVDPLGCVHVDVGSTKLVDLDVSNCSQIRFLAYPKNATPVEIWLINTIISPSGNIRENAPLDIYRSADMQYINKSYDVPGTGLAIRVLASGEENCIYAWLWCR